MPTLRPFRAIRYAGDTDLARVTAPPYDVISPSERELLESLHPCNIVRLTLEADAPEQPGTTQYRGAAERLREWLASGVLVKDETERLFLYRCDYTLGGRPATTAGVVGALTLEPLGEGAVFPHERTMPGPKSDRLALMRSTGANLEPLWLVASEPLGAVGPLAGAAASRPPLADLVDPSGVRHRVWALEPVEAEGVAAAVGRAALVVADGHHRYETALTYRDERRARAGPGPWDATLALIADPEEMQPALLPIHRIVRGAAVEDVAARAGAEPFAGDIESLAAHVAARGPGTIGVAAAGRLLTLASTGPLDTAWLSGLLEALPGEVAHEHDLGRLAAAVDRGALGFVLAPVPVGLVVRMALAGERMPPKTTLFWPKPRTGLLLRDL